MTGFEGFLPFLNEGRQYHACARYTDQYGKNVKISSLKKSLCRADDFYNLDIFGDWWLHRTGEH